MLRRRGARANLTAFTEYTNAVYLTAPHHRLIAGKLESVERGEIDRLMIFMPPRHGKSELASRRFPAWYLGRNPDRQVIAASYNSDLATDFGRDVRNIVASSEYAALFPACGLREDSRAADRWNTDQGGAYVAAGVGTAVTGRGAHVLLIDDPLKDREEADSALRRQRVWDWYTSTAYTRLMPGGAVVVIQTRWHEDDLAGRLLAQQAEGGDQWDILDLPALNDAGEALWPEWYGVEQLHRIRAAIGTRDWSALYQQRPVPDSGDYFESKWLHTAPIPFRDALRVYGASDYAVTAGGGDYTVHIVVGIDAGGRLYVLDLWRGQTDSAAWIEAWCDLVLKWRPSEWAEEGGQIRASVGPFLERRMAERKAYTFRRQFQARHDKAVRAQSIRARMSLQGLYLPAGATWRADFESELLRFPAGVHDDQVDALGLIGQLLDHIQAPAKPEPTKRPQARKDWFEDDDETDSTNWKVA
jgi:predicted phage terminase large subunit-like protein